jgi:uncharacterized membrane protein YbaN (DUF454 family)
MELIKKLKLNITPIISGIIIGIILGVAFYLAYAFIFHESSSEFYLFAGLALLGSPLIGSIISALKAKEDKPIALLISGSAILLILIVLYILVYVALPVFFYESVQLPASYINDASGSSSHMPSYLNYSIPGIGTGRLITGDKNSVVVVMSDYDHLPYISTVYLINKSSNKNIRSLNFNNDIIGAAIDQGTLYIFNDKIGYFINTENGEFVKTIVRLDNYRGIFTSNNNTYMQTTLETSALNADGSVVSHRRMYMNCTAFGCFISGSTGQVME